MLDDNDADGRLVRRDVLLDHQEPLAVGRASYIRESLPPNPRKYAPSISLVGVPAVSFEANPRARRLSSKSRSLKPDRTHPEIQAVISKYPRTLNARGSRINAPDGAGRPTAGWVGRVAGAWRSGDISCSTSDRFLSFRAPTRSCGYTTTLGQPTGDRLCEIWEGYPMAQSSPPLRIRPDWSSWIVIAAIVLLLAVFGLEIFTPADASRHRAGKAHHAGTGVSPRHDYQLLGVGADSACRAYRQSGVGTVAPAKRRAAASECRCSECSGLNTT